MHQQELPRAFEPGHLRHCPGDLIFSNKKMA
jgi:hypothetical protein